MARGRSRRIDAITGIAASRFYRALRSGTHASNQFEPERPPDHARGSLERG